jgi:hypothetical protein
LNKKIVGGIGVATGIVAIALAVRKVGAAPAAGIKLSHLNITPVQVYPGQDLTITILATNNSKDLTLSATINMGGDFMAAQTVTLAPGQSQVVSFTVTPSAEGTYQVAVDGLSGSFVCTVAPHADIRVENLVISPASCYVGDTVTISVTVTNYGNAPGIKTITCTVS